MGLFTNPVTFTVNTVARVFNFRAQLPHPTSVIGEWIEPAAALSAQSRFLVKHTSDPKQNRSLLQYSVKKVVADGITLKPIVVNFTIISDPEHTNAQIDECLEMNSAASSTQTFRDGFAQRLI